MPWVANPQFPQIKIFFGTLESPRHILILPRLFRDKPFLTSTPNLSVVSEMSYHRTMPSTREKYIAELERRAKESHVYRNYQLIGLEIADILDDRPHKALYIKLAKEGNPRHLLAAAKGVAERKEVKRRGAYFMRVISEQMKARKPKAKRAS